MVLDVAMDTAQHAYVLATDPHLLPHRTVATNAEFERLAMTIHAPEKCHVVCCHPLPFCRSVKVDATIDIITSVLLFIVCRYCSVSPMVLLLT
jgi:hypothetical protein